MVKELDNSIYGCERLGCGETFDDQADAVIHEARSALHFRVVDLKTVPFSAKSGNVIVSPHKGAYEILSEEIQDPTTAEARKRALSMLFERLDLVRIKEALGLPVNYLKEVPLITLE